ncbi:MAG: hypothetical protein AMJ84_07625 [Acidithiobacillales bacterium SM23_46]|nr:MAG: hypothetical protein AMJ84_07625 [Acidithiobacillales bacterium SM23_46]
MEETVFEALQAGATLITAGRRLARDLARRYGERMLARGHKAWPSPQVLAWPDWIARHWQALAASEARSLLDDTQALRLWESVILDSRWQNDLLQPYAAAALAQDAWNLMHAWRLPLPDVAKAANEDLLAFAHWVQDFERTCSDRHWIDAATLPDVVSQGFASGALAPPERVLLAGFDELTPQQARHMEVLRGTGVQVMDEPAPPPAPAMHRLACRDAREEFAIAATWARRRLEADPSVRIGIVVPGLGERRALVVRALDEALAPGAIRPDAPDANTARRPYHLSLGLPLADFPLVHAALLALELGGEPLPLAQAGSFLRSPFFGAMEELPRRAALDVRLRRIGETRATPHRLLALATDDEIPCPELAGRLRRWRAVIDRLAPRQLPSAWSQIFAELLALLGWPGSRTPDSAEYQTLEAWRELLVTFAALDAVSGRSNYVAAVATLRRLAIERVFEPRTADVPVQVLGLFEAAGLEFDHLWVSGLDDSVWPASPRANPFLDLRLQRARGLPHSSAERELAVARRATVRLLGSAREVMLSHASVDGEQVLRASPLITGLAETTMAALALQGMPDEAERLQVAGELETLIDAEAPALTEGVELPGGTRLFRDQSACPFRAFAHVRLDCQALAEPQPGLDAAARGTLLHDALRVFWQQLGSHARLVALSEVELTREVSQAVAGAIEKLAARRRETFTARFRTLEQQRLEALVLRWLVLERERRPFVVRASETRAPLSVGGLRVEVIADRVDQMDDGRFVVIDYKTGRAHVKDWYGARPAEPQLPLYAIAAPGTVAALAYARLRPDACDFRGLAHESGLLPAVGTLADDKQAATVGSWEALLNDWRVTLEALAAAFRTGAAAVDPRDGRETCEQCDLEPLCRVHEHPRWGDVLPGEPA